MASIRNNKLIGTTYHGQLYNYGKDYVETASYIREECGKDLYTNPRIAVMDKTAREILREKFINESYDPKMLKTASAISEHTEDMNLQFENDVNGLLEHTATGEMNPIIGMSTYMHKWILMNTVFDKGAIQKVVTDSQKYTLTQQYRYFIDAEGTEYDMAAQQMELSKAVNKSNPVKLLEVTLPELKTTDFVRVLGGTSQDHLSIITMIDSVYIEDAYFDVGDRLPNEQGYISDTNPIATEAKTMGYWHYVDMVFSSTFASNDASKISIRDIKVNVKQADGSTKVVEDTINAMIDENGMFTITSVSGQIKKVRLKTRLDSSNGLTPTGYVRWREKTIEESIPDAIPINTTITPDELKDISSLYKIDQTAEIMDSMKTVLTNYKDDTIKSYLDDDYVQLPERNKKYAEFDYASKQGYYASHVDWVRDTFFWFFDSYITHLYQIYNDPNLTVSTFGSPDLVRKITPTTITFDSSTNIGPVDLDFFKKISTSDRRTYQWIGADKMRGDDTFMIILNPTKDTRRITYRIIDYMTYIGNEIRNAKNSLIPCIHAYERFRCSKYNPVQGRVRILNPTGLRDGDTDAAIMEITA